MTRCHTCWNFETYCTCTIDALERELVTRCCACGNRWAYCTCHTPYTLPTLTNTTDVDVSTYPSADDLRAAFEANVQAIKELRKRVTWNPDAAFIDRPHVAGAWDSIEDPVTRVRYSPADLGESILRAAANGNVDAMRWLEEWAGDALPGPFLDPQTFIDKLRDMDDE